MMRLGLLAAMLCMATPALAQTPDEDGWTPLFNGENLEGWTVGWAQEAPAGNRDPATLFTVDFYDFDGCVEDLLSYPEECPATVRQEEECAEKLGDNPCDDPAACHASDDC